MHILQPYLPLKKYVCVGMGCEPSLLCNGANDAAYSCKLLNLGEYRGYLF